MKHHSNIKRTGRNFSSFVSVLIMSLAFIPIGFAATPWQTLLTSPGSSELDVKFNLAYTSNLNLGYTFKPLVSGEITELCGLFDDTEGTVALFKKDGFDRNFPLANAVVIGVANGSIYNWSCTAIIPLPVQVGVEYVVMAMGVDNGSFTNLRKVSGFLPATSEDISIISGVYQYKFSQPSLLFSLPSIYGQPDVTFVPEAAVPGSELAITATIDPILYVDNMPCVGGCPSSDATFSITVANNSPGDIELEFYTTQQYVGRLINTQSTVVTSSDRGQVFAPIYTTLLIKAGESKTFAGKMELTHDDGSKLEAGNYTAEFEIIGQPSISTAVEIHHVF